MTMIHVYFIVLENSVSLDLVGSAEALRVANQVVTSHNQPTAFELHHVGFTNSVTLSANICMADLKPVPKYNDLKQPAWVVLLGQEGMGDLDPTTPQNQQVIDWLKTLPIEQGAIEVITVCAGSLFLAYAGRLTDRKVTTHHRDLDQLARIAPSAVVQQDCVFVEDGAIASSAGVTTGIDLIVHKIAQVCGELTASEVAQWLVIGERRSTKHTQTSKLLIHRTHLHPAVHRVQAGIIADPTVDWTLPLMANLANTSPRHLSRLFKEHTGISALQYVTQVRLSLAKSALSAGHSVTESAEIAGFGSDVGLRRAWHQLGETGTPSQYAQATSKSKPKNKPSG